jgi:multidrug resistance efflux pump
VKVTQRLPVRIELVEPNPDETSLFAVLDGANVATPQML